MIGACITQRPQLHPRLLVCRIKRAGALEGHLGFAVASARTQQVTQIEVKLRTLRDCSDPRSQRRLSCIDAAQGKVLGRQRGPSVRIGWIRLASEAQRIYRVRQHPDAALKPAARPSP
jgi:hypothetical protein